MAEGAALATYGFTRYKGSPKPCRLESLTFVGKGAKARRGLERGWRIAAAVAMAVNDALPAGFEIETLLGPDDAQTGPFKFLGELSSADVQEARDDRYVAAMDLAGKGSFSFAYVARAVSAGEFLLPGAQARDMYRPAMNARTAASRTTIAPGP